MEATLEAPSCLPASRYWGLLKDLEAAQKLELVSLLVDSLRPHPARASECQECERGFRNLAGCRTADSGDDDVEAILRRGRASRPGEPFPARTAGTPQTRHLSLVTAAPAASEEIGGRRGEEGFEIHSLSPD